MLAYESGEANKMGAAKIYFIVFGILTIAGGVVGYVKAGSMASIVAGPGEGQASFCGGSAPKAIWIRI